MPTYPCSGPLHLELRAVGGEIRLDAEPRDTADVEVAPCDRSQMSREFAEQTQVEFRDGHLTVVTPELTGRFPSWRTPRVKIHARVPTGSRATVRTVSADVTCRGEWASVACHTVSGEAVLERIHGDLTVHSVSTDVRVDHIDGGLLVKTGSGDLAAGRIDGPVEVRSGSGDVEIDRAGADVNIKTASGDVQVGAVQQGDVRVHTLSGDVSVGVTAGTGVWLDLSSLIGSTRNRLDLTGQSGSAGDAAMRIRIRSLSGNITVDRVTRPDPAQSGATPPDQAAQG